MRDVPWKRVGSVQQRCRRAAGTRRRLRHVLLGQIEDALGHAALADAGEDERDQMRRDAGLQGIAEHTLLDLPLFQAQGLLARLLFLLPPPVFLRFGFEPGIKGGVGVLSLGRRRRERLVHGVHGCEADVRGR
jgi:hypothetical protein